MSADPVTPNTDRILLRRWSREIFMLDWTDASSNTDKTAVFLSFLSASSYDKLYFQQAWWGFLWL